MSPQIATVSRCRRPLARRIVSASKSACVGCSWHPSPAFRTAQLTFSASRLTAPDWGWRTTSRSGCMAFSVSAVSIRVSPFLTELACIAIDITSAPSRLPASSKLAWVRVEVSKNMLIWVRPASASECLRSCRFRVTYSSDKSRSAVISAGSRGSIPKRWRARNVMGPLASRAAYKGAGGKRQGVCRNGFRRVPRRPRSERGAALSRFPRSTRRKDDWRKEGGSTGHHLALNICYDRTLTFA